MLIIMKAALPWIAIGLCVLVIVVNHIKTRKLKQKDREVEGNYMSEGMCLGLCAGLAVGNEWMSLGVLVGMTIGMMVKKK